MLSLDKNYDELLRVGRPPNVTELFPNSRALLVSGKIVDRAMRQKTGAMTIAANGRNTFVIRGVLKAAQRANAAVILEIAKSEGGPKPYCAVNMWNLARIVDAFCNELGVTVPVAIHADHFAIKNEGDLQKAKVQIPSVFDAGVTSIAIDASHLPDQDNLLANLELAEYVPNWSGYETEVGEIKGKSGMSTPEEALFLIRGLNASALFPDWIALNNGSTHGLESTGGDIDVELTAEIHAALEPYKVSGAQHGTSGNNYDHLRRIVKNTRTTKANVATALQMLSWGVRVNEFGNAELDAQGNFIKESDKGVTDELWEEMVAYANEQGWQKNNYKKLNLPFENLLQSEPRNVRQRMVKAVEDFTFFLLQDVFNAGETGDIVKEILLDKKSHDPGPKAERLEDPKVWTREKIASM
ncbi:MAG: class II fructose-bisphosphate aldolase [Desulfonatronovibrionaceae bacterium]